VVSFFLERIPLFQIQRAVVADPFPQEPRMARWAALMPRGGGGQEMSWHPEFFIWLRRQLIVIQDWPYAGTNFMGDPDLPLPEGEEWEEELGMNSLILMFFIFFLSFLIHACSNDDCMYMQMWAQSDQPAYPLQRGEANLQPTLRLGAPWGRS